MTVSADEGGAPLEERLTALQARIATSPGLAGNGVARDRINRARVEIDGLVDEERDVLEHRQEHVPPSTLELDVEREAAIASRVHVVEQTIRALELQGYNGSQLRELVTQPTTTGRILAFDERLVGVQIGRGTYAIVPRPHANLEVGDRLAISRGRGCRSDRSQEQAPIIER